MEVCSKRGLLAGPGRGCWFVDHVDGALGAWKVAGTVGDGSWVSTGTTGVEEAKARAGARRASPWIARRSIC
jgi:hypothetical protein